MRRRERARKRGLAVALLFGVAPACGTTIDLEPFESITGAGADAAQTLDGATEETGDADVCSRDVDGACLPELLAEQLGDVYSIAVRNGHVYFAAFSKGYVGRVATSGGPHQTVLPAEGNALALALDDTQIHVALWASSGTSLVHASLADPVATRTIRDTCPKTRDVVISPSGVFALGAACSDASRARLVKVLPEPGSFETLEREPSAPTGSLVAFAGTLFWTTETRLLGAPDTLTGIPSPIYDLAPRGEKFLSIAIAPPAIYARTSKAVLRVGITTSDVGATELAATGLESARLGIALSATDVYYASPSSGQVFRVAKSGGPVTSAARDDRGPLAVTLDGSWLYWTNQGGELRRRHL